LKFCSLSSSSSGNSYLISSNGTTILCDVGIAGKNIKAGLENFGLGFDDVDAIVVTHEHTDHVKSIRMLSRKAVNAGVYMSEGSYRAVSDKVADDKFVRVHDGGSFMVGDIEVAPFALSHDAVEPLGYSFISGGRKLSILTDTGVVTSSIYSAVEDSDAIVLEANHELNMLRTGPYPYELKQRIAGRYGHLSNDYSAKLIADILKQRTGSCRHDLNVMLAHLSSTNNTPKTALSTVTNILFERGFCSGTGFKLEVAPKDTLSGVIEV
jgi:phosphoribosyl 1,2-cyclic phosphodiesterase